MARMLDFEVPRRAAEADASRELDALLHVLHERGLLRIARNFVAALPEIGAIAAGGLNNRGTINTVSNLALIAESLGRLPPSDVARILSGLGAGLEALGSTPLSDREKGGGVGGTRAAPGLRGALQLLRDDDLWRGLMPLLDAIRAFGQALDHQDRTMEKTRGGGPNI